MFVFSCGHYWGLSGLLLAPPLYGPWNGAKAVAGTIRADDTYIKVCVAIWTVSRLCCGLSALSRDRDADLFVCLVCSSGRCPT